MTQASIRVALAFDRDDQAWIRQNKVTVPNFWDGHAIPPAQGDVLRFAGRQFVVHARVWEHEGGSPVLRLFLGSAQAQSDTVFG